ncbi:hypothetical protein RhiJN_24350 [Ceratobasidium sp. AG-Ba]|nr:hypothetical protein RhiJN_24350 [Ceratobasidium sp. AG-Ba]
MATFAADDSAGRSLSPPPLTDTDSEEVPVTTGQVTKPPSGDSGNEEDEENEYGGPGERLKYTLSLEQQNWLRKNFFDEFVKVKRKRGTSVGQNGKKFTHKIVVPKFLSVWHPGWDRTMRLKYLSGVQYSVYNTFNNMNRNKVKSEAAQPDIYPTIRKIDPSNEWARDHAAEVDEEVTRRMDPKGLVKHIGKFVQSGRRAVDFSFVGFMVYVGLDEDGRERTQCASYVSDDIKGYLQTQEFGDAEAQLMNFLQIEKDLVAPGLPPAPSIIPDVENNFHPIYPEEIGDSPAATLVRKLNRQYANACYSFNGGVGPVPWQELTRLYQNGELRLWIPSWPEDVPFGPPHKLSYDANIRLLSYFRRASNLENSSNHLWFARVIAGTSHPDYPDISDVSTMELGGRVVHIAHFDRPVARPQANRPVAYTEQSWRYYYHLTKKRSLDHWLGLKTVTYDPTLPLISLDSIAFVRSLLEPIDIALCRLVVDLLARVNEIQRHGPHETDQGIWDLAGALQPLPDMLPASKPSDCAAYLAVFLQEIWAKPTYALSSYAAQQKGHPVESTSEHMYSWLDSLRNSSFVHNSSRTVQGGSGGLVWVVALVVRMLLNTAIVTLDAKAPEDPPEDLDLASLGDQHSKIVRYLRMLDTQSRETLEILSGSSAERVHMIESVLVAHCDAHEVLDDTSEAFDATYDADSVLGGSDPTAALSPSVSKGKRRAQPKPVKANISKPKVQRPVRSPSSKATVNSSERRAKSSKKSSNPVAKENPVPVPPSRENSPSPPLDLIDHSWFEPHDITIDFSQRKHVFGRFAAQPPVPDHTGSPQDLLLDLQASLREMASALSVWTKFDSSFSPYSKQVIAHSDRLAKQDNRTALRPIYASILLHRAHWNRSKELWPKVVELNMPITLAGRKLTAILKAIDGFVASNPKGPVQRKLQESCPEVRRAIYHCRGVSEILRDLERLSTSWSNRLHDAWQLDLRTMTVDTMMGLAHSLAKWQDETLDVLENHQRIMRHHFLAHELGRPFPKKLNYKAGCPDEGIFDGMGHGLLIANPTGPYTLQNLWVQINRGLVSIAQIACHECIYYPPVYLHFMNCNCTLKILQSSHLVGTGDTNPPDIGIPIDSAQEYINTAALEQSNCHDLTRLS